MSEPTQKFITTIRGMVERRELSVTAEKIMTECADYLEDCDQRELLFELPARTIPGATHESIGTGTLEAIPAAPFRPRQVVLLSESLKGLLVQAVWVGHDLQLVSIPGQSPGIPAQFFNDNEDQKGRAVVSTRNGRWDVAHPGAGIMINISNRYNFPLEVSAVVIGRALSTVELAEWRKALEARGVSNDHASQ